MPFLSPPRRIIVQDVKRCLCALIMCNFMLLILLLCVSLSLQSDLVLICFLVDVIIFCCLYFQGSCDFRLDSVSVLLCILHDIGLSVCALPFPDAPYYRAGYKTLFSCLCAIIMCNFMLLYFTLLRFTFFAV